MKQAIPFSLLLGTLTSLIACAPVNFTKDTDCGQNCVNVAGKKVYSLDQMAGLAKVDILFVNDNSGSMSFEQNQIADRFSSFIQTLDNKRIDYRIGVTTTDISSSANPPRPINAQGALQDGRLIPFRNAQSQIVTNILTPATADKISLFARTIARPETLTCERFLNTANPSPSQYSVHCPSADEQGLLAARMSLEKNGTELVRSDSGQIAVIFVTDEDERSQLYQSSANFKLQTAQLPHEFVNQMKARFPGKVLSVYSIVVSPGTLKAGSSATQISQNLNHYNPTQVASFFTNPNSRCLSQQSSQTNGVRGSYGYVYALTSLLTNGIVGDICASDYGAQLTQIGENIGEKIQEIALNCENPEINPGDIQFEPKTAGQGYRIEGAKLILDPSLKSGTRVYGEYACPE